MPGFGPLSARASVVRPAASPDAYGVQTWFKPCTAPGAEDGTVLAASWFNHMIGQYVYAAGQAGVEIVNDHSNDTYLWQIIQKAIDQRLGVSTPTTPTPPTGGSGQWNLI